MNKNRKINGKFRFNALAAEIYAKREKLNLTYREMSEQTGLTPVTCQRAEVQATKSLDISTIIPLCNWIGRTVQYFITPVKKNTDGKKAERKQLDKV